MTATLFLPWLGLTWGLGWAAFPLSRRLFRQSLPDNGLAAGRVGLLAIWTLTAFLLGHAGVPVWTSAWFGPGLLVLGLGGLLWDRRGAREEIQERRRGILASELAFLLVFLLFFWLRGFWSDFNGTNGEKSMDAALIGVLTRSSSLPPENPYSAGAKLSSYYYGGHLQTALLTVSTGTTVRWSYNLMCATVPALCFSLLVSLGGGVTGSVRKGCLVASLVLVAGTLQPLWQWLGVLLWYSPLLSHAGWFDPLRSVIPQPSEVYTQQFLWLDFFGTSRVIPYSINEFPWFSMNQADLHGHYLDFPNEILMMSLAWAAFCKRPVLLGCGPVLAVMVFTNTWDFFAFGLLIVGIAAMVGWQARGDGRYIWLKPWGMAFLALGLALTLASPYLLALKTAANPPRLLEQPASPLGFWLLLWGPMLAAWLAGLWFAGLQRPLLVIASGVSLLLLVLTIVSRKFFGVLGVELGAAALSLWCILRLPGQYKYLGWLAFVGLAALIWSETTWAGFLGDPKHSGFDDFKRQDTVFKFGIQAWLLWGTAAASAAVMSLWKWPEIVKVPAFLLLLVMMAASMAVTVGRTANFGNPFGWKYGVLMVSNPEVNRFDAWDGWAHLAPPEKAAAQWLEEHIRPGEAIMEAEMKDGGDYTQFTRYTGATGIPTVIGPMAHSFQWAPASSGEIDKEWEEVLRRKSLVRLSYEAGIVPPEFTEAKGMAVRYIICGQLERREYGARAVGNLLASYTTVFRAGDPKSEHRIAILRDP